MPRLHAYIGGVIRGLEAVPIAIGGVGDHVHLLIGFKATHTISKLVQEIKKRSNSWVVSNIDLVGFGWQDGYAAFTVSPRDRPAVIAYISDQPAHHRRISGLEELRALLVELGVDFDERFFA